MAASTSTLCQPDTRSKARPWFLPPPPSSPESALWCGRNKSKSGYRNIYFDPKGGGSWRIRIAKLVNIEGRWRSPRDAAAHLAAFLANFYGQYQIDWKRTLVRRRNLGRIIWVKQGGYYLVHAFVLGRPVLVSGDYGNANLPSHVKAAGLPVGRPPVLGKWKWATIEEARAARREWIERFRSSLGSERKYSGLWLWQ